MAEAKKVPAKAVKTAAKKTTAKKTAAKKSAVKTVPVKKVPAMKAMKEPTYEEISVLAHKFWLERGGHHGWHEQDWLRAEKELKG